jgi:transcriptional regulator with XRE-family HTH domain
MKKEIKRVIRAPVRRVVMSLADLRVAHGFTQTDVAKALGVSPTVISKRESNGPHLNISTLRDYVRALGDQCEIVFVSKLGHRITIDLGEEREES